jgi:hypothetical protein
MSYVSFTKFLLPVLLTALSILAHAQNLEEIGVKKGVKVNGSVNLNAVGYYVHGMEQRRDPFNWFLTGNLNIDLFGYSAPFSFSYSNANKSFSQPFNQFSFAPQYKWVKTYIGYNSMTFSNYTLAGHIFLGGGVELTPGKWRIAAMYGRLRKAVPFDLNDTLQHSNASFKRMGYGLKVGYEDNGDMVSFNVFTAKDDINSIPFVLPESLLTPQQNVAMSLNFRKKFLKRFFVEAEYAVSALNKDTRANDSEADTIELKATNNIIKGLLPENATSRYYDALNASVGYQGNWYSVQVKYERIAPEYQTLGAYYFNNDMRNITIAPNVRLLKNTLNLAGNVGFQENNLDDARESTTERFVGSVNANYLPNERWNFVLSYSNFSSYTNVRPQQDPFFQNTLDTLNFYQVSQTTNAAVIHNLGSTQRPQSIMLNLSYQKANDNASYEGGDQQSDFVSANASYSYSIVPSATTLAISGNVYTTNAAGIKSTYWGPTLSITKAFLDKTLRGSWTTSYNETSGNNIQASPVLNNRLGLTYAPKAKNAGANSPHNLSLGLNVLNRLKDTEQQPAFSEYTGTFNYTYNF